MTYRRVIMSVSPKLFGFPLDMDIEMIPLCQILNLHKGITTLYSCHGHNGKERFYVSFACTAEGLETLYKIFDHETFEFVLSDKCRDQYNKNIIEEIEFENHDKRFLVSVYTRIDESERDPFIEIADNKLKEICTKALDLLLENQPEMYNKFLKIINYYIDNFTSIRVKLVE